ncbi:MAG: DoxX family protein [Myxococcota bacterium]
MKDPKTIAYWIITALVAFVFFGSGAANAAQVPEVLENITRLGYPAYFAVILGSWKILAALALLAPGLPRLKEWAYAGLTFAMSGAFISHVASGDPIGASIPPLIVLALVWASWALRPESRRLPSPNTVTAHNTVHTHAKPAAATS